MEKRLPKYKVVNEKAVANIGLDTIRNYHRYNRVTKKAIGERILDMAAEVARVDAGGVYGFEPGHGCGSVPFKVKWRDRFKHIIIIFTDSGDIIIIHIIEPRPVVPKPDPNPVECLEDLKRSEFTHSAKYGDMRTIDMKRDGKLVGRIQIFADKPQINRYIHRR